MMNLWMLLFAVLLTAGERLTMAGYVHPNDITHPNGLQIRDIAVPEGCSYRAQTGDYMHQDYTGYLMDGTVFDSSRGHPYRFHLGMGNVIKGVDQGMDGMCKGEKRTLIFPPQLGYGNRALDGIPAGSTLKFVLQLTDIVPSGYEAKTLYLPKDCPIKSETGDFVREDYNGTLTNGTIFDTSYQRHRTYNFKLGVGKVIRGVDMGMMDMCQGERRKITVPAILGYGDRGVRGLIPGGATVIFDVELVEIQPGPNRKPTTKASTLTTTESTTTTAVTTAVAREATTISTEPVIAEKLNNELKKPHHILGVRMSWRALFAVLLIIAAVILVIAAIVHKKRGGRSLISTIRKGFKKPDKQERYHNLS